MKSVLFKTTFTILILLGFVNGAWAQTDVTSAYLTNDMFYRWDGYGADASHISTATVDSNFGQELDAGSTLIGTSTVDYLTYADLTGYSKIQFEGTSGTVLRVLMNRQESNEGPWDERQVTIDDNGNAELDLTEFDYVHLNAIKINWGSNGTVTAIKLSKPVSGDMTTIMTVDYSTLNSYPYYRMGEPEGSSYDLVDGMLQIENTVEQTNVWDFQPFIADFFSLKEKYGYIVRITYKSSTSGSVNINMGTWDVSMNRELDIVASDTLQIVDVFFQKSILSSNNNVHALIQCGKLVGTIRISKVEIIEIEPDEPIVEPIYINVMVNGHCGSDDCVIGDSLGSPIYSMTCKEYGSNLVVNIEEGAGVGGSRASVVRTLKGVKKINPETGEEVDEDNWACQFFVTINHKFKTGEKYLFRMKYRADRDALITTEAQGLPQQWLYWAMLGDLNATSEWQSVEKYGTITEEQDGMQTIGFNLYNLKDDNTYYFDDIEFYINQYDATEEDLAVAERVSFEEPDEEVVDELAMLRETFWDYIYRVETITDIGKTEASFSALQNTIERICSYDIDTLGEEEINQLWGELTEAINNLELLPGYSYLTKEMFKRWDKCDAANVTEQGDGYGAYNLITPTDLVYGDVNVNEYKFADLSDYDNLYITTYYGTPRILMNRTEANGQFNSNKKYSKMLEIPKPRSWTDAYYTKTKMNYFSSDFELLFTYDIAKIVKENGFAHLNAIKGAPWGFDGDTDLVVMEMLLYKDKRLNIDETGQGTFCRGTSLDFSAVEGVKAYAAAQFIKNANTIIMTRLTEVPTETGVYIKGTPGTYTIPSTTSTLYCANMLKGFVKDTSVDSYEGDMANYYFSPHSNSFNHVSETMIISANTAILQLPASLMNGAESRPIKMLFDDEDATAIEALLKEAGESGNVYDLQGRQVNNPRPGLYIKNGKKIVVK